MKCKIIACYIGKLPIWMPLWIKSCENNSEFDFLIVTDDNIDIKLPKNVTLYKTTLFKIKEKIQINFSFEISLEKPYKLCDYRPIYGLIFSRELKGYDYWGHCDLDMVFGDLNKFLLKPMEKGYEKIGSYGHLTLYKNSNRIQNIYKLRGAPFHYKTIFTHPQSFFFDEMRGVNLIANKNGIKWYQIAHNKIGDKMNFNNSEEVLLAYRQNFKNQKIIYHNQKIIQLYNKSNKIKMVDLMYYHFSKTNLELNNIQNLDEIMFLNNKIESLDYKDIHLKLKNKNCDLIKINYKNLSKRNLKKFLSKSLIDKIIYMKYMLFKFIWGGKIKT